MESVPDHRQRRPGRRAIIAGIIGLAIIISAPVTVAGATKTKRVSVKDASTQARGSSGHASISRSGRFVAFESTAGNLVVGDSNGLMDCFVRDQSATKTYRVSVSSGGAQGDGRCGGPSISDDGNFVAFESAAANLVAADSNGVIDVFLRDRGTTTTTRVSVSTGGVQGSKNSRDPAVSGNGRFIAFESLAGNLVPGDTNGKWDIFVHDRITGTTERVSVRNNGGQANGPSRDAAISKDGRYVVFFSTASNIVGNDRNGKADVFLHDRSTGKTQLISRRSNGARAKGGSSTNASVSANGRYVAFDSAARNLVNGDTNRKRDVFIRDRQKGSTRRISVRQGGGQANGNSVDPAISADGKRVAYSSVASNLVRGDSNGREDVFVRNVKSGNVKRQSVRNDGKQAKRGDSDDTAISASGRFVAFESGATNLYPKDTNGKDDIFRRGPLF